MPASLGHSITALLPIGTSLANQERLLVAIVRACPGVELHDVLHDKSGAIAVRASMGEVTRLAEGEAPEHVGRGLGSFGRHKLDDFEDHGDVLLWGWDEEHHQSEIEIAGETRLLGSLEALATIVDATLADAREFPDEYDAETIAFQLFLKATIAIAIAERLPIVAHW